SLERPQRFTLGDRPLIIVGLAAQLQVLPEDVAEAGVVEVAPEDQLDIELRVDKGVAPERSLGPDACLLEGVDGGLERGVVAAAGAVVKAAGCVLAFGALQAQEGLEEVARGLRLGCHA